MVGYSASTDPFTRLWTPGTGSSEVNAIFATSAIPGGIPSGSVAQLSRAAVVEEDLITETPTDAEMVAILAAVQHGDDIDALLDNQSLAEACNLSLEMVAARLAVAKQHNLIWGSRSGQRPAPWYSELELTVQGRRFLA